MSRHEGQWDGGDGTQFFFQTWEPPAKPKALVVLVHGLGEHSGRYVHVGRALTDAGYVLAGFDLRGHGRSGGAPGHTSSLEAYLQDIGGYFRMMEQRHPGVPQFLYGHSLGGILVLAYAIQYGSHLNGVIATGPGLRSALREQKGKVAAVRLLGSILPRVTFHSGLDADAISRDPETVKAYRGDPLVHFSASLGFGKAALHAIDLCFSGAPAFPVPLLLMHGQADSIAYPSGSEDFARILRGAGRDVTLKVWEGLYHEIHNEPEQDNVFRFMIEWLDRHL